MSQKHACKRKIDGNGIGFRIWLAFLLFGLFIIGFLWLTQVVFLQVYVNKTKQTDFANVAEQLKIEYNSISYKDSFDRIAYRNGYTIDVLKIEGRNATVLYSSSGYRFGEETHPIILDLAAYSVATAATDANGAYLKDDDSMQLTYGVYTDAERTTLILISQSTQLLESTTGILRIQMVIITVVIVILSFCISFLLSSAFSQNLRLLSDTARKLSENDFSVQFVERGFTEARELASALNFATGEMRKTEELQRELIANVSHDLRTPLTIIKGYAEMVRDLTGEDKEKRNAQLGIIIKEADRLTALVSDLLQLSKMQNGNLPLNCTSFDLSHTVQQVCGSFDLLVQRDGYRIEADLAPQCWVNGDQMQLQSVIYNLVGNAINYTGEDKKVSIRVWQNESTVTFSVSDTGQGMDEEQLRYIWQRYYRAQHKRSVVGTGLGLSIVQTILKRHDAQFGVESRVGEGSTFWFSLPLVVPDNSEDTDTI